MTRHTLGRILQALPDGFGFSAVLEENDKKIAKNSCEKPLATTQIQQANQSPLESKNQGLCEQDFEQCTTHYYDLDSRQWIDVKSYWFGRIKEELKLRKIAINDRELESIIDGTSAIFQPSYRQENPCYYEHFHHYEDFFTYELKIFMDYYKMACYLYLQNDKWLDYESYWHIRVRQELESNGIFMGDKEFESLLHLTHPIIKESFSWCEKISDLGRYELHNFIVEYKERSKLWG